MTDDKTALGRRAFVIGTAALGAAACVPLDTSKTGRLAARLRIIEAASGGSLGVSFLDTGSMAAAGQFIGLNRQTRYGQCSSFKLSLAAMVLRLDQSGMVDADQILTWSQRDLLSVSPFTTSRLNEGATMRELAEAAQKFSDNTAANVLMRRLGGPNALTQFWRSIGDSTSRLDRTEPALNNVPAGEMRDTTTPDAMARTVATLCFGNVLDADNRATLRQWMTDTRTGAKRVRAGLPDEWVAGDKTGTSNWPGMGGLYVDIGFVQPANRPPITFATYYRANVARQGAKPAPDTVLSDVGRVLTMFAAA